MTRLTGRAAALIRQYRGAWPTPMDDCARIEAAALMLRNWRASKGGQAIAGAYECSCAANDMRVMRVARDVNQFATYLPQADDLLDGRGTTEADAFIDLLGKLGAV